MISRFPVLLIAAAAAVLLLASASFGSDDENDNGLRTADQAKAMLAQAVAAVKADKAKALDMFDKGEGGFRDGNLYVSCFNISDGKFVATGNPNEREHLGEDGRAFKDVDGNPLKLEATAQKPEGDITIVDIKLPKPGANKRPEPIEIFATKVNDLICEVGYYYYRDVEHD